MLWKQWLPTVFSFEPLAAWSPHSASAASQGHAHCEASQYKAVLVPSWPHYEMFSVKKSFFHSLTTISPFRFSFGSGVQRHYKVLRESEATQTLPAHPVQITLLWDLWKSLKTNAMKMEEQGDHSLCFTEARTFTENINGMDFFFILFIYFPLKEKRKKKRKMKTFYQIVVVKGPDKFSLL